MAAVQDNPIDKRILALISKHHVLSLATTDGQRPWLASCFYTYMEKENLFVFTSDAETIHGSQMLSNPWVAGNILLETKIPGKIRGLQMSGKVRMLEGEENSTATRAYIKRFPIAALMKTTFWGFEPELLKMTDNRLGFGVKLYWRAMHATP